MRIRPKIDFVQQAQLSGENSAGCQRFRREYQSSDPFHDELGLPDTIARPLMGKGPESDIKPKLPHPPDNNGLLKLPPALARRFVLP